MQVSVIFEILYEHFGARSKGMQVALLGAPLKEAGLSLFG